MSTQDRWAQYEVSEPQSTTDTWAQYEVQPSSTNGPSPTLMASRREASKQEFGANRPESTPWSRARELALGAGAAIGMTGNPTEDAKNFGLGLASMARHPVEAIRGIPKALIAGPMQAYAAAQSGDYDAMANAVGQTIATDIPVAYGAGRVASQGSRLLLAGGPQGFIEQMLRGPAGSAAERQTVIAKLSPQLSRDVELLKAPTQTAFDKIAWKRFQQAKTGLNAAEQTIPAGTTVAKQPLLTEIDSLADKYRVAGQSTTKQIPMTTPGKGVTGFQSRQVPQYVSVNQDALNVIRGLREEIAKLPDSIPFEDLRELRQKLDKAIQTSSGWRETGNAADKAQMLARKDVVNTIRAQLSGISPQMDMANAAYSKASDLVEAANLNYVDGRRLGTIGQATKAQQVLKTAAKVAGTAAVGYGGYELAKDLSK